MSRKRNDLKQEEIKSLHENHTYDLVELPKGERPLKNKWVYRLKTEENSSQPRYKVRLVVKGFSQRKVLTLMRFSHRGEDVFHSSYTWYYY